MQTYAYTIIKGLLYITLIISGFNTVLIPALFTDKMIKSQRNYIGRLSIQRRLSRLSIYGWIFIVCAIISIILGLVLAKLDSISSDYDHQKHLKEEVENNKHNFKEVLTIELRNSADKAKREREFDREKDELVNKIRSESFKDSLSKNSSLIRENKLINENLKLQLAAEHKDNIQLQQEINSPELVIIYDKDNPSMYLDSAQNLLCFSVEVVNKGKGIAYNVKHHFTVWGYDKNNLPVIYFKTNGKYDVSTDKIDNGLNNLYLYRQPTYDIEQLKSLGQLYIAIKITYNNSFHQSRIPIQNMFYYNVDNVGRPARLISDHDFEIFKSFLIKEKEWQ